MFIIIAAHSFNFTFHLHNVVKVRQVSSCLSEELGAERGWARPQYVDTEGPGTRHRPARGVAGRGSLGLLPGRHLSYYGEEREKGEI